MQISKTKSHVNTVSKEELARNISDPGVQIVNVLDPEYYYLGFIKGSLRIPVDHLNEHLQELDRSKEIVTYCADYDCHASTHAAEFLAAKGFRVAAYEGGIREWKEAGLPSE